MIKVDGDRSLKRKWFAEKKLAQIKEMDLPASCVIWDGFRFKTWQLGDIDGGRVTAPMGAVVACSTENGIKIAVADYWAGGFSGEQDLYVVFKDLGVSGEFTTFFNGPIDVPPDPVPADYEPEYFTVKFTPEVGVSGYGLVDGDTPYSETVYIYNAPCTPLLISFMGELYNIVVNATVKYDLAGDGTYDWIRHLFEKNTSFYIANGSQQSRMNCVAKQIEYANLNDPLRTYQKVGLDRYISYQGWFIYDFVGDPARKVVGFDIDVTANTESNIYFEDILNNDMPSALRTILTDSLNDGSCEPIGSYAFGDTFFHAVNASCNIYSYAGEYCDALDYYVANPLQDKWRLFYSMTVDGVVYLVNSDNFLTLLDSLADNDCLSDWYNAQLMLTQLAGAYPNMYWNVPYDSVMFHGHDGNIYTWTRKYGAVKFTTTDLSIASVSVPLEVSEEDGVRPDITYAGTFDTIPLYLCLSNKVGFSGEGFNSLPNGNINWYSPLAMTPIQQEIKAVHYGSPFTTWNILPGVQEGATLVHVRPALVTPERIFLIGIIKMSIDIDEVPTEKYFFASLDWTAATETTPESTDLWKIMGMLPFDVSLSDNLSVGLYGDGYLATVLAEYPCPPIVPQTPVGPYDKYAIGLP
jgi:hypothetical protein